MHPASSAAALLACIWLLPSCQSSSSKSNPEPAETPGQPTPAASSYDGVIRRGEPLSDAQAVELGQVLAQPEQFQGKTIKTQGTVRRACSRKGCWMELAEGRSKQLPGSRVTFKDYGFFVPLDSAGAQATVEGEVQVQTVRKSHVERYEQEGAVFADKNPDGSANEVRIVATGVELVR